MVPNVPVVMNSHAPNFILDAFSSLRLLEAMIFYDDDFLFGKFNVYVRYSRNVNRFVCNMFMALVASYASITQEILISLAPSHR